MNPFIKINLEIESCIFLQIFLQLHHGPECDVPVPGIPSTGNFSFVWWYRNWYRDKLVPEKVSEPVGILKILNGYRYREFFIFLVVLEPVSVKFGIGKKYRNRYRSNLVSEKSTGIRIKNIWCRKKVSVFFNILGTVTHCHGHIWEHKA